MQQRVAPASLAATTDLLSWDYSCHFLAHKENINLTLKPLALGSSLYFPTKPLNVVCVSPITDI